jgi:hypothetical protein
MTGGPRSARSASRAPISTSNPVPPNAHTRGVSFKGYFCLGGLVMRAPMSLAEFASERAQAVITFSDGGETLASAQALRTETADWAIHDQCCRAATRSSLRLRTLLVLSF